MQKQPLPKDLSLFLEIVRSWNAPSHGPSGPYTKDNVNWTNFSFHFFRNDIVSAGKKLLSEKVHLFPQDVLNRINEHVRQNTFKSLANLKVLFEVDTLLRNADIRYITLKGPVLSQHLFGSPSYRQFGDIDLFISPSDIERVNALLEEHGYIKTYPSAPLSPFKEKIYRKRDNYVSYMQGNVLLEIHWRLFENNELLDISFDQAHKEIAFESMNGVSIPRLGDAHQFMYLCAHGAKHQWVRLKWVEDIAALLVKNDPRQIDDILDLAAKYQLVPVLVSAIELAHIFFLTDFRIAPRYKSRKSKQLCNLALRSFYDVSTANTLKTRQLAMTKVFLRQFSLKSSPSYKFNLFLRWLVNTEDWINTPLPDYLFPLYIFIRPFLWVKKKLRCGTSKP